MAFNYRSKAFILSDYLCILARSDMPSLELLIYITGCIRFHNLIVDIAYAGNCKLGIIFKNDASVLVYDVEHIINHSVISYRIPFCNSSCQHILYFIADLVNVKTVVFILWSIGRTFIASLSLPPTAEYLSCSHSPHAGIVENCFKLIVIKVSFLYLYGSNRCFSVYKVDGQTSIVSGFSLINYYINGEVLSVENDFLITASSCVFGNNFCFLAVINMNYCRVLQISELG